MANLSNAWKTADDLFQEKKQIKKETLSANCHEHITGGFLVKLDGKEYHFNYEAENQHNFTDTIRLFENNMIEQVGWNTYDDGKKVRLQLDKPTFEWVYLSGVKHKNDALSRLNDNLYPLVDEAISEEQLELIEWENEMVAPADPETEFNTQQTLEKQIKETKQDVQTVDQNLAMTNSGLLELTMATMNGFGG